MLQAIQSAGISAEVSEGIHRITEAVAAQRLSVDRHCLIDDENIRTMLLDAWREMSPVPTLEQVVARINAEFAACLKFPLTEVAAKRHLGLLVSMDKGFRPSLLFAYASVLGVDLSLLLQDEPSQVVAVAPLTGAAADALSLGREQLAQVQDLILRMHGWEIAVYMARSCMALLQAGPSTMKMVQGLVWNFTQLDRLAAATERTRLDEVLMGEDVQLFLDGETVGREVTAEQKAYLYQLLMGIHQLWFAASEDVHKGIVEMMQDIVAFQIAGVREQLVLHLYRLVSKEH